MRLSTKRPRMRLEMVRVLHLCFGNKWNFTSCACQDDLSLSPLIPLQITWQVTACQVNLSGDPSKITCASCLKTRPQGGGGGSQSWPKRKFKIYHFLIFSQSSIWQTSQDEKSSIWQTSQLDKLSNHQKRSLRRGRQVGPTTNAVDVVIFSFFLRFQRPNLITGLGPNVKTLTLLVQNSFTFVNRF